jgi:hypothetical protein
VCPTIVLFSLSTNQSPIGGSLATTSFRLKVAVNSTTTHQNIDLQIPARFLSDLGVLSLEAASNKP